MSIQDIIVPLIIAIFTGVSLIMSTKAKRGVDFNAEQMGGALKTIEQLQTTVEDLRKENVIIRDENTACRKENTQLRLDLNILSGKIDDMGKDALKTIQKVVDTVSPPEK